MYSSRSRIPIFVFGLVGVLWLLPVAAFAQMAPVKVPAAVPPQPVEDNTWWYVTLLLLGVALIGAIMWMLRQKKAAKAAGPKNDKIIAEDSAWDSNSVDADKEMEWFRRHKKTVGRSGSRGKKNLAENLPKTGKIFNRVPQADDSMLEFSEQEFKQKLQNLQFSQLPIFKFSKLEAAGPFAPLAISNDDALMSAIEQTHDEYEEDEEVRDLAVRILTRFKTRNSIEALSQVALYDISSNVRSKAVSILADFDHESVFETILLCCADPTREVRAAAARGLFRLSFDRSDAWTRIAETGDEFRMRQAALAAREADLVKRSFDRLVHQDTKIAYEAVTLLALLIKAGETEEIFSAIETHPEDNVKLALVHVIGLAQVDSTIEGLYRLLEREISKELKDKIDRTIESFAMIPA